MTFKEFFLEWQKRDYVLTQTPNGDYSVLLPNEQVPPKFKSWIIKVNNGELQLPRNLEPEREAITQAYFKRVLPASAWSNHNQPEEKEYQSDVIDPEVFDKGKPINTLNKLRQPPFKMNNDKTNVL